jgi:hypothetical protein
MYYRQRSLHEKKNYLLLIFFVGLCFCCYLLSVITVVIIMEYYLYHAVKSIKILLCKILIIINKNLQKAQRSIKTID